MMTTSPPSVDLDDVPHGQTERERAYTRALHAEPRLEPVVRVVDALVALVRPTDTLCYACTWETIISPLVYPWIGWARGDLPETAPDTPRDTWAPIDLTSYLDGEDRKVPADTDTERWLRTSDAFDAFTRALIDRLYAADPAHGHGIGAGHHADECDHAGGHR